MYLNPNAFFPSSPYVFSLLLALTLLATLASIPLRGRASTFISLTISAILSLYVLTLSIYILFTRRIVEVPLLELKYIPSLVLVVDPLTAFFLAIISIVGFASSIYGIGYVQRFVGKEHLGWFSLNYVLFLLSMMFVVSVRDLLWFIVFWELMTLSSQFLVAFEKEKSVALRAGLKYFCITKLGSELMLVASIVYVWYLTSSTSFEALSKILQSGSLVSYIVVTSFLALAMLIKCASVPFHSWLPDAHPEAPTPVSALLSGAMIKVPIYFLARVFLQLSKPCLAWGYAIAVLGCITLFVGTMYALVQYDSKKLLAYHSVGQIGYVLLALGAAIAFYASNQPVLAFAAFTASLFHALNHAIFKSLLFLTAGSVLFRTGTRDLNVLGGLARSMPVTAFSALIASLSIAGLPPFNGFASKWLIYASTMLSGTPLSLAGAVAMFVSSVTTASFIKYFATMFAGSPRIDVSKVREVPPCMTIPQLILATLCIALGVAPGIVAKVVSGIASTMGLPSYVLRTWSLLCVPNYSSAITPLFLAASISIALPIVLIIAKPKLRAEPWVSGAIYTPSRSMPAKSFYRDFEEVVHEPYSLGEKLSRAFFVEIPRATLNGIRALTQSLEYGYEPIIVLLIVCIAIIVGVMMLWI